MPLAMAVPGKGNAAADWLDTLGSQTVTLKCHNEPATLSLQSRRLRRESGITFLEHLEEKEKQNNHLAHSTGVHWNTQE